MLKQYFIFFKRDIKKLSPESIVEIVRHLETVIIK
jgi:hypothetical protein